MVTFLETKLLIGKLLGIRDITEDGDIIIDLSTWRFSRYSRIHLEDDSPQQITISNAEMQTLYDKVSNMNSEGVELYSGTSYEIALNLDLFAFHEREISIHNEDTTNHLVYELTKPSIDYCMFLLISFLNKDSSFRTTYRNPPLRFMRPIDMNAFRDESDNISLTTILQAIIGEKTLKITTSNGSDKTINQFRNYKTSFLFEFMYKSNVAVIECNSLEDILYRSIYPREKANATLIDTPPAREYTEDVVDYYKLALSSRDPYIKYLSFYHVIEYFYDEVFKKHLIYDLKEKITHPDFSYKNDDSVYEMAKFVKNRWQMNHESGQGNELESLKFVLNEYVSISELKTKIDSAGTNGACYYQNNKVPFCDAPVISWNNTEGVVTQIAKRIYFTRNSLVHSKSGKNKERYKPYKDEKDLQKEIPLVKAVAEAIIINSSNMLE